MPTSSNGAKFIACREALVTQSYEDGRHADGTPKYSIGFGSQRDEPKPGDTITIEAAFALLRKDLESRDAIIAKAITAPIKQQEWDAVASLFYQSGTKALRAVAELFNAGKPILALGAFMQFNSGADGKPTDGHTKRRAREMIVGIDGHYGDLSQVAFFEGDPRRVPRQFMPLPEDI